MANRQGLSDRSIFVLQQTIDYFDNFWKYLREWTGEERIPVFQRFRIPYWSPARPDPAFNGQPPAGPVGRGRDVPFAQATRSDTGGDTMQDQMRRFFEEIGYTFVKVLGAGSQGVAALFEYAGQKLVIKWSQELPALATEMWAEKKMVGARHIVQRKWRPGMLETGWDDDSAMMDDILTLEYTYAQEMEQSMGRGIPLMYGMEFMKHGNLNGLLRKISSQQAYLKDSEIWRVFMCLFRACVALTYPGLWAPPGFDPNNNDDAPTQEEFVPSNQFGGLASTENGILNFDMNDRNIMIGDFSADPGPGHSHDQVPVVKVGDLGVITRLLPRHRNSFFALVACRVRGNMWYHTPEQFTDTWKNVDGMESLAADDVAGKYGWTTNLWQVGRLMTIMITRMMPDVPPTCTQRPITVQPDGTTRMIWTYSGHLLDPEFDHYDRLLRSTVAWCMAHRPADRPGIRELESLLMDAVAFDRTAAEAQGRVSIAELLGVPATATRQETAAAAQDTPAAPAAVEAVGPAGPGGRGGGGFGGGRGVGTGGGRGGGAGRGDDGRGGWRGGGRGGAARAGGPRGGGRGGGGDRGRGGGDRGRGGGNNRGGGGRGRGRGARGAPR